MQYISLTESFTIEVESITFVNSPITQLTRLRFFEATEIYPDVSLTFVRVTVSSALSKNLIPFYAIEIS